MPVASFRIEDGGIVPVPTVSDANILVAGSRTAFVVPSDLSRFRLNVGVRTFNSGATLTMSTHDGATLVRTVTRTFAPNYFAQLAASDLTGGAVAANQTIVISVDAGSAVIYGSSVSSNGAGSTLQVAQRLEP